MLALKMHVLKYISGLLKIRLSIKSTNATLHDANLAACFTFGLCFRPPGPLWKFVAVIGLVEEEDGENGGQDAEAADDGGRVAQKVMVVRGYGAEQRAQPGHEAAGTASYAPGG